MFKNPDIQFLESIKKVFEPIFNEYGFELQEEVVWNGAGEDEIRATKKDIALVYYFGHTPRFYLCNVGIRLSGELAERATSIRHYHNMGVTGIAHYLDKDYNFTGIDVYTNEDLIQALEQEKEMLLKYCKDILSGDVSVWSEVVKRSEEYRTGSGKVRWHLS
jgi:hypothetical protein